jgi:hypothetical protein
VSYTTTPPQSDNIWIEWTGCLREYLREPRSIHDIEALIPDEWVRVNLLAWLHNEGYVDELDGYWALTESGHILHLVAEGTATDAPALSRRADLAAALRADDR